MTAKKAGRLFHYLIAGFLLFSGIFLMAKNAIAISVVFLLAFIVFFYASPKISPKSPFRLAKTGKVACGIIFIIGILVGATIDAERLVTEESTRQQSDDPKVAYINTIKNVSEYVTDVDVSESQTEISISIKRTWDEGSYFEKAGEEMWRITQQIHKDIPIYASNQLLFVLYAPFENGQERTATITYRPEGLEADPLLFERVNSNSGFLNAADRVITHRGQAGKRYLTDWCDEYYNNMTVDAFCQKARGQ